MESAREFIERVSLIKEDTINWNMSDLIALQEARDAAIRKDCADRAIQALRQRAGGKMSKSCLECYYRRLSRDSLHCSACDASGSGFSFDTHEEQKSTYGFCLQCGTYHVSGEKCQVIYRIEPKLENAAIRKDCADRAVEWQKGACRGDWDKCRNCPDCDRLRAAIEGE